MSDNFLHQSTDRASNALFCLAAGSIGIAVCTLTGHNDHDVAKSSTVTPPNEQIDKPTFAANRAEVLALPAVYRTSETRKWQVSMPHMK